MLTHSNTRSHVGLGSWRARSLLGLRFLLVFAACLVAHPAQALFIDIMLPGNSIYDGWAGMTGINYPGYGNFPGAGAWPAPIVPTEPGSDGMIDFVKLAGNGYPAGASVYAPFTESDFSVATTASTPFDVETVIFQMDMGPGDGGPFFVLAPALNYNGGTQALAPDFEEQLAGAYPWINPVNPSEMGSTSVLAFQWDLRGLGPITSYEIVWTTHPHAQMYELQADSGDTFEELVPEPTSGMMLMSGLATLVLAERWRTMHRRARS